MMRNVLGILVLLVMCSQAMAQQICTKDGCFGSGEFAARLNARRVLIHDEFFNGPEVVFKADGIATEAQAIEAWQKSPGHAALLPSITDIECVGNACVGRGAPLAKVANASKAPFRFLKNRKPLRSFLNAVFVR